MEVTAPPRHILNALVRAADMHGVPLMLAAGVAWVESRFDHSLIAQPSGARGVMQLTPAVARSLGVDPADLEQNIEGGVRGLAQLREHLGDWQRALSAFGHSKHRAEPFQKYALDVREAARALQPLLPLPFEVVTVAPSARYARRLGLA